jgi:hypothetical protein
MGVQGGERGVAGRDRRSLPTYGAFQYLPCWAQPPLCLDRSTLSVGTAQALRPQFDGRETAHSLAGARTTAGEGRPPGAGCGAWAARGRVFINSVVVEEIQGQARVDVNECLWQ